MQTLDAGVGYHAGRGGVDVRARRVGTRDDVFYAPDFSASRVTLPAYTRVDLSAELGLLRASAGGEGVGRGTAVLTLRVENAFDAHYTDVAGVNYDFASTDAAALRLTGYRAAPRRVLAGVRLGF
jgi:hypothetical protein